MVTVSVHEKEGGNGREKRGRKSWVQCRRVLYGTSTTGYTRNVLTFVNTTAIAYRQNSAFLPGSWHHAIVVVFTNVRTLRVLEYRTGMLE